MKQKKRNRKYRKLLKNALLYNYVMVFQYLPYCIQPGQQQNLGFHNCNIFIIDHQT